MGTDSLEAQFLLVHRGRALAETICAHIRRAQLSGRTPLGEAHVARTRHAFAMSLELPARFTDPRALDWCTCCGREPAQRDDQLCAGCRTSARHKENRQRAAANGDERAARRMERLALDLAVPAHLAVFPQAVLRAGYESRLRTVRLGATPFTLARFMRGQKWALGHRERIRAALDADPRVARIRGKGHPQWRRVAGPAQSQLPVLTITHAHVG